MFDADTISLKKLRASQGAQRFEMSFQTLPQNEAVGRAFVESMYNFHVPDSMVMPQIAQVHDRYSMIGYVNLSNSAEVGDSSIRLLNNSSQQGLLPQGYFIKFANHDKVYVLVDDADMNGTANRTVNIYPPLQQNVPGNTNVRVEDDCKFVFLRDVDSTKGIVFQDGILSNSGTISLVEAV